MRWATALGLCALLGCESGGESAGDGGTSSSGSAGSGGGGTTTGGGAGGKVVVARDNYLKLLDTATGEELGSLPFDFFAEELHVAGDAVVLGGSEGELVVADAETLELRSQIALGSDVEAIASVGDEAFVALLGDGTSEDGPAIARVDLANVTETSRFFDVDVNEQHAAMLAEGDDLIVLVGNGFALERVSTASETVVQDVPLGQNPDDPEGPRGEFYGYGMLASAEGRYWVFDEYSDRLLGLDATSFAVQVMHHTAALLENAGATHVVSDGSELFLTLADKDQVVVFDGETGEVARTYDVADGARAIGVKDGLLYLDADETFGELLVLDAQTGDEVGRVGAVYADFIVPL
jgi:outer membrane protein assembly factor BamB